MSDAMDDLVWPEERRRLERASSTWWAFVALGVVAAVLGLLLVLDLFTAVATLAVLVALGLLVTGIGELLSLGRYRPVLNAVAGVALVVGGVLALVWPDITLWALALVVGVDLVVVGVIRIVGALELRGQDWGWLLAGGVLSVVVGLVALVWPEATILVLGVLLGVRVLLFGIEELAFGLALRSLHRTAEPPRTPGTPPPTPA
ncbi:MAG TPA: DUF308 domain-containing protein [Acidimicrobiales bacterium]|nr:DUF308 domain-containing protein [Acidimicrobiales bacterium]